MEGWGIRRPINLGWRLGGVTGTCEAGLHVPVDARPWGRPAGGANHCKTNSIGGKGRPSHLDPLKGFGEGKAVVLGRKHCKIMWGWWKGNIEDYWRTDWHCSLGTWTSHEVYCRKKGGTGRSP